MYVAINIVIRGARLDIAAGLYNSERRKENSRELLGSVLAFTGLMYSYVHVLYIYN